MQIQVDDFNLEATLDSGQVFGFVKNGEGIYEGAIGNIAVQIRQNGNQLDLTHFAPGRKIKQIPANGNGLSEKTIRTYFDLDHDLAGLYGLFSQDERLVPLYHQLRGLRVIRQDPWEALACFIISSNNNIKRIQLIRRNLLSAFSTPSPLPSPPCRRRGEGEGVNVFPGARAIARSTESELRRLGLGYRAPFLLEAAKKVAVRRLSWDRIHKTSYSESKAELMKFPGVGEKVADCTLLFGFQKYEAFPVDVWIHRVMKKLYFRNRRVSERKVQEFAQKRWGVNAGYVQQYLYHGARRGIV
ncbi:MAG: hypothetical protein HY583_00620 [Candidatus Omnitrophica bacterium]|nr:hypothetical protein [Candidatus Omnitrophota bacterium]